MYHHNVKLSFKSFVLALLTLPFLAVTVGAQTTTATQSKQPSIKRAVDEKEFRRLIGLPDVIGRLQQGSDRSTLNAAALAAIGATQQAQARIRVGDEHVFLALALDVGDVRRVDEGDQLEMSRQRSCVPAPSTAGVTGWDASGTS